MKSLGVLKRITALICFLVLVLLCGCVNIPKSASEPELQGFNILCSSYPQYDWLLNITEGAEDVNVSLLLKDGVDVHSFQPSADDIIKIHRSDMFVINGGESDKGILDVTAKAEDDGVSMFVMTEELGGRMLKEDASLTRESSSDEAEEDEHIWLSLKNAGILCDSICERLVALDAKNAEVYTSNTKAYKEKLNALDEEYKKLTEQASDKALIFADRFPFLYMANDYSLNCYAAFQGCSSETEASFNTVLFLADKAKEYGVDTLLTVDGGNGSVADAVKANLDGDIKIMTLNSMQSVTREQRESGMTYLSVMAENLEILKTALGADK